MRINMEIPENADRDYRRGRTPEERLAALELMRQKRYKYNPESERMQRSIELLRLRGSEGDDQ